MKLCTQCRYFKRDWSFAGAHFCRSPRRRIDPVDGHAFCMIERSTGYMRCGPEGAHWEPKLWRQMFAKLRQRCGEWRARQGESK